MPFNDIDALAAAVDERTCAVMLEPIQGEGGIRVPPEGFLQGLREIANGDDLLLIFDEVQAGFGRTGTYWAFEHYGVKPDLITCGKGISCGLPPSLDVFEREFGPALAAAGRP